MICFTNRMVDWIWRSRPSMILDSHQTPFISPWRWIFSGLVILCCGEFLLSTNALCLLTVTAIAVPESCKCWLTLSSNDDDTDLYDPRRCACSQSSQSTSFPSWRWLRLSQTRLNLHRDLLNDDNITNAGLVLAGWRRSSSEFESRFRYLASLR